MEKFTNPLDNIKIESPCKANWNEMIGSERKRYCSDCKLNVYNLSDMTQTEAENFLINSEGRVCLRVFRRNDGTVLTKNCPIGLHNLKRKVSQRAAAVFAVVLSFFSGIISYEIFTSFRLLTDYSKVSNSSIQSSEKEKSSDIEKDKISFGFTDGIMENLPEIKLDILKNRKFFKINW